MNRDTLDGTDALQRLEVGADCLTGAQARQRPAAHGPNRLPEGRRRSLPAMETLGSVTTSAPPRRAR